jgi:hypothetical protein
LLYLPGDVFSTDAFLVSFRKILTYVFPCGLHGRGFEVLLLLGDDEAVAGRSEENANRKTLSDLLSFNPHENNVCGFPS